MDVVGGAGAGLPESMAAWAFKRNVSRYRRLLRSDPTAHSPTPSRRMGVGCTSLRAALSNGYSSKVLAYSK